MNPIQKSNWRSLSIVPIILLVLTAILKTLQVDFTVEEMTAHGLELLILSLVLIKLVYATVIRVPRTPRIIFLLSTAYTEGIIAASPIIIKPPIPGTMLQVLLWGAMYFKVSQFFNLERKILNNE